MLEESEDYKDELNIKIESKEGDDCLPKVFEIIV